LRKICLPVFFLFCLQGAFCEDKFPEANPLAFRGALFVITEENGLAGDVSPLLFAPGFSFASHLGGDWYLEFSADLYWATYAFPEGAGQPLPVNVENRSAWVFSLLAGADVLFRLPIGQRFWLRIYAGPGADLRLCLNALYQGDPDYGFAAEETDRTTAYFWGEGRWFYPNAGLGFDIAVAPKLLAGLDLRAWFPVYRLWTGESLPPWEGWRFAAGFRVTLQ
jgi:hypothetical protein